MTRARLQFDRRYASVALGLMMRLFRAKTVYFQHNTGKKALLTNQDCVTVVQIMAHVSAIIITLVLQAMMLAVSELQ